MMGEARDLGGPNAAALVIHATEMSAPELRGLVGLEPDRSWDRGDPVGSTRRGRRPFTGWRIDVGPGDETPGFMVRSLLDRVRDVAHRIRNLAGDPRVHAVSLWVWSEDCEFALELPPERLGEIANLGASLKVKVYDVRKAPLDGAGTGEAWDTLP